MAQTWFIDATAGSDSNGGSSEGTAKASGTGAATTISSSTVDLSVDTPDLSGVNAGDTIRLNSRTDGIRSTDIFEILTVDDGADTITVSPTPSSTTSGVTWAIGGALATLNRVRVLQRTAAADADKVWIKGGTSYTETVTFAAGDVGLNSGSIVWEGYTATTGDGGMFTIDGGGSRVSGLDLRTPTNLFLVFKNMRTTTHTGSGVLADANNQYATFKKCRSDSNGGHGFVGDKAFNYIDCYSHDNTFDGFTTTDTACFIACIAENNGSDGFTGSGGTWFECLSFANAAKQFSCEANAPCIFINCIADGDNAGTEGFRVSSTFPGAWNIVTINCIGFDCVTGFKGNSGFGDRALSRNNSVFSNSTADYADYATLTGEVTSDPLFVNEVTRDYGPGSGSPLLEAGYGIKDNSWGFTLTGDTSNIGAIAKGAAAASVVAGGGLRGGFIN